MMCTKVPVDARQDSLTNRMSTVHRHTGLLVLCVCKKDKRTLLSDGILQGKLHGPPLSLPGPPCTPQQRCCSRRSRLS